MPIKGEKEKIGKGREMQARRPDPLRETKIGIKHGEVSGVSGNVISIDFRSNQEKRIS